VADESGTMTEISPDVKPSKPTGRLSRLLSYRDSLRVQALLFTALPLAILLALALGAVFYAYQQVAERLVLSRDEELARISAERLSENIGGFVRVLSTIANLDIVTANNPVLQKNALIQAREILIDFDGGVIVLNPDGIVTVTEPFRPDLLGQNLSDRPYFQLTKETRSFTFSDIIPEESSGEDIIVAAVPIISRDGAFQGVLAGRFYVGFQRIGEEIRKLSTGDLGEAYLVDRNGRVIYHPDYALIGADFSQRTAVSRLMTGEQAGAIFSQLPGRGRQVVGFAEVDVTGWTLVIQEPWGYVVAPAINSLRPVVLVLLLGIIGLAAIVSAGVQRILYPIGEMAAYARRVASGDYDIQVPPNPVRELRDMGAAFNEMVQQISRYQAGLRQYVAAITYTQEEERRRIARDLHDDTVQSLIAIGQRLELARDTVPEHPTDAVEQLRDLRRMITRTIDSVREFSRDLRPTALEDLGLVAALQHLVNTLCPSSSVEVAFSIEGSPEGLSPDMEVTIYRIVQEALTNVRKHAGATQVQLQTQFLPDTVQITIRDNGVGFSVPEEMAELASEGHFGLMGIKERAQLFGGQATIESTDGTTLLVTLPRQLRISPTISPSAPMPHILPHPSDD
jgi:signal transduction histidine kinase